MKRREVIKKAGQAIAGSAIAGACSQSEVAVTGPSMNTEVEPIPDDTSEFNAGPMVSISDIRGFSAFGLAVHDTQTQRTVWRQGKRRGYNMGRVGAESESWPGGVFPRGRSISDGALEDFKKMLKIAADEDMQVMVMAVMTAKENGTGMPKLREWCKQIAIACRDYQNIIIEAVNEYWHPRSTVNRNEAKELIRILRRHSNKHVTTDVNLSGPTGNYGYDGGLGGDIPDFHPWRNPDPTRDQCMEIVEQNGGRAIFSETTAYGGQADKDRWGDLVTTDKRQIDRYMSNILNAGGVPFFHSIEGLTAEGFSWMPEVA